MKYDYSVENYVLENYGSVLLCAARVIIRRLGEQSTMFLATLPPENPPLEMSNEMIALYGEAMLELGKLNEMANRLPNVDRFIKAYVIKEALLSSAIEGH